MRAWLLLLAVLATFKPIVQVASTEDLTTRFITAISTRSSTATTTTDTTTTTTTTRTSKSTSTAFAEPYRAVLLEDKKTSSKSSSTSLASASASSAAATSSSSSSLFYTNSDSISDSDKNSIDKSDENLIIEIKNIEETEGGEIENKIGPVQENNKNSKRTKRVHKKNLRKNSEKLQSDRFEAIFSTKLPANPTDSSAEFSSGRSSQTAMAAEERSKSEVTSKSAETESSEPSISSSAERELDTEHHQHKHRDHQHKHKDHNHHHQHRNHQHHHHHHHHKKHHHDDREQQQDGQQYDQQQHDQQQNSDHYQHHDHQDHQDQQQNLDQQQHEQDQQFVGNVESNHSADSDLSHAIADDDSESEPETFSNKEVISEKLKPDPSTLVEIENSLLSLFNMKRPPKIDRSKIVIPEAMKQLYAQIMGHDIDSVNIPKPGLLTKSANTVRSFTHLDSKIDERFPHHHRFRLHFDVKSIPAEEKLKAAELQLSRKAISHTSLNPRLASRTRYQVLVYDITRLGVRGKREPTYLLLDNKTIRLNSTDTISLDVQPAVDRWLETPKKNYGLLIEVRTFRALKPAPHHHVRLRRSADETHDDWQRRQPLLFTYTDDGRHKSRSIRDVSTRSKRAGHHRKPHRRKNNEEICRRQSLYVDFTDVGWSDWIVAPPGYDAYYCHGKCPFPLAEHLNSTNHAVVQTLVNNLNPGKVPKACCVPTQLTGISMLYLNDQSTVVLKNYQDMTVVGCGCR